MADFYPLLARTVSQLNEKGSVRSEFFRSVAAIWLALFGTSAGAADIKISDHPSVSIVLEGTLCRATTISFVS
jgi:hypothetical protein